MYLITGGLGGIGLAIAEHLGRRFRARLILTGRTGAPPEGDDAGAASRKIDRVGIEDDFFALGGDSLTAVQLVQQTREALAVDLPPHCLLEAPTIAALASMLRERGAGERGAPGLLVRLRAGQAGRRPLFLVHPIGGQVYHYRDLVEELDPTLPVHGLRARGLEAEEAPIESIEEMARVYVEAIRAVQPHGPYAIGGASFGGIVAYEMARQLLGAGEAIAAVLMVDSPGAGQMPRVPEDEVEIMAYVLGQGIDTAAHVRRLRAMEPADRLRCFAEGAGAELRVDAAGAFAEQMGRYFRTWKTHMRAMFEYRPKALGARVAFFKAAEPDEFNPRSPELGLKELSAGGMDLHVVPGNHATMNTRPHARALAERMARYLAARADERAPRPISEGLNVLPPAPR